MQETVRKNAGALVEILNRPDDLDDDVAESRDALIEELIDDPYAAQLGEIFQEAVETREHFQDVQQSDEPFVYCRSGNPAEVTVEDWPTTTYQLMIDYNSQARKVRVSFTGTPRQKIVREEELPRDISSEDYEAFIECLFIEEVGVEDPETIIESDNPIRELERLEDRLAVDLRDTQTRYIVDTETNEVVKTSGS